MELKWNQTGEFSTTLTSADNKDEDKVMRNNISASFILV